MDDPPDSQQGDAASGEGSEKSEAAPLSGAPSGVGASASAASSAGAADAPGAAGATGAAGAPPPGNGHQAGPEPVRWRWPAIHPQGRTFAIIVAAVALFGFFWGWAIFPWLALALAFFVLAFFRDPVRASPGEEGLILAPADGLISQIMDVDLPRHFLGDNGLPPGKATRISIFMSVFDVHINRTPVAGKVTRIVYVPGAFLSADLDKASDKNERQYFVVEGKDGARIGFTQIAGMVARRIVSFVHEGTALGTGERVGLIRFGSRVDVFLPAGYGPRVVKGQKAVAGETILAARNLPAAIPGPRQ